MLMEPLAYTQFKKFMNGLLIIYKGVEEKPSTPLIRTMMKQVMLKNVKNVTLYEKGLDDNVYPMIIGLKDICDEDPSDVKYGVSKRLVDIPISESNVDRMRAQVYAGIGNFIGDTKLSVLECIGILNTMTLTEIGTAIYTTFAEISGFISDPLFVNMLNLFVYTLTNSVSSPVRFYSGNEISWLTLLYYCKVPDEAKRLDENLDFAIGMRVMNVDIRRIRHNG